MSIDTLMSLEATSNGVCTQALYSLYAYRYRDVHLYSRGALTLTSLAVTQYVHQPCAAEPIGGVVVRGAGQCEAGVAVCQAWPEPSRRVQWNLWKGLPAL